MKKKSIKKAVSAYLLVLVSAMPLIALQNGRTVIRPVSNSISNIAVCGNDVWIGTGRGLLHTNDSGESWRLFTSEDGLPKGSISALAVREDTIWVAGVFDTSTVAGDAIAGGGLSYSVNKGETWTWLAQPVDADTVASYTPVFTNVNNTTWDIEPVGPDIWIASWGGGVRKSSDMGQTWQVVTVDGLPFDIRNNNYIHMGFAVRFDGQHIWVGSAAGIHKSSDMGKSFITFTHQNQSEPISGNWIRTIQVQPMETHTRIWAGTADAVGEGEFRAVSYTDDYGLTWTQTLKDEFVHNFAAGIDGAVYAASDNGLFKSNDFGKNWAVFPAFYDYDTDYRIFSELVSCAAQTEDGTLWAGTGDGIASSSDGGYSWTIYRAFQSTKDAGQPETYAYPNPFSPSRHNLSGGDGYVRFQYHTNAAAEISIDIFDFGMNKVASVVRNKSRQTGDFAEIWDGRNDLGEIVANGVYFYRLERSGHKMVWGKIMVVD